MLFIGLSFLTVVAVMSVLSGDYKEKAMDDFCRLECKQDLQKENFCC